MENYSGNKIKVAYLNTAIIADGLKNSYGTSIYVADINEDYGPLDKKIWIQDLAIIQNAECFMQGIKYIDMYASPKAKEKCLNILKNMQSRSDYNTPDYAANLAFFCDLGLWKNKKLCIEGLWHKDFPKYLANCMWNYERYLFV